MLLKECVILLLVLFYTKQKQQITYGTNGGGIIEEVKENEFPFMVLLVRLHEISSNGEKEEVCYGLGPGVLINKNSIIFNENLFHINTGARNGSYLKGYYVIYGKVHFKDILVFFTNCRKIKKEGARIISHVKNPVKNYVSGDDSSTKNYVEEYSQIRIVTVDKNIQENGKNIMYAKLYDESDKDVKDDLILISYKKNPEKRFEKMSFPYLDCDNCKFEKKEMFHCFLKEREGCVGYLDHK